MVPVATNFGEEVAVMVPLGVVFDVPVVVSVDSSTIGSYWGLCILPLDWKTPWFGTFPASAIGFHTVLCGLCNRLCSYHSNQT